MVVLSQHKGNIVNIFVAQKISFFKKAAEGKPWPLPFNHLAHGCPVSWRSLQEICHIFAFFGRDFRLSYQNIVMRLSFNAKQIKMWRQREFSTRFPSNFPFFSAARILLCLRQSLCSCSRENNSFATAHLCRRSFLRRKRAGTTSPSSFSVFCGLQNSDSLSLFHPNLSYLSVTFCTQ